MTGPVRLARTDGGTEAFVEVIRCVTRSLRSVSSFVSGPLTAPSASTGSVLPPAYSACMRRQLCDEHVAAMNQATHLEDAMLRRISKRRLLRIEADILLLDKRLAELVSADPRLANRYQLLISMPGVGPTLAYTLPRHVAGTRPD